jgi:hypothetical protein
MRHQVGAFMEQHEPVVAPFKELLLVRKGVEVEMTRHKSITIQLPEEMDVRIREIASASGLTITAVIRGIIDVSLKPRSADPEPIEVVEIVYPVYGSIPAENKHA